MLLNVHQFKKVIILVCCNLNNNRQSVQRISVPHRKKISTVSLPPRAAGALAVVQVQPRTVLDAKPSSRSVAAFKTIAHAQLVVNKF